MIPDSETDFLYLAETLHKNYLRFFGKFQEVLTDCNITFGLLPDTKDIWAVDYMPIQVEKGNFVQFVYDPGYLKYSRETISDVDNICKAIDIITRKSPIKLDGGNVVRTVDKVIMCDRIFKENPKIARKDLVQELENIFHVEKVIFIPTDPYDFTGHADGILRFYDNNTVLMNEYLELDKEYELGVQLALHKAGLNYIKIPFNVYDNINDQQANGEYINFLQMKQAVIVPTFGIKEDEQAVRQFEELFHGQKIATILCKEIAEKGGILNCISWNISIQLSSD
jgi:agmatine deiminase